MTTTRALSDEAGGPAAAAVAPSGYPPIDDYGLIGDGRTAALVSRDGAVEWMCMPHFSGPSIFAAVLDRERGGHFTVRPPGRYTTERRYEPATAVLITLFHTADGVLEVTDCMPVHPSPSEKPFQAQRELLRRVRCVDGAVDVEVDFQPRPEYATRAPAIRHRGRLGWSCNWGAKLLHLHTDLELEHWGEGRVGGRRTLRRGQTRYLSLTYTENDVGVIAPLGEAAERRLDRTRRWWRQWSERCNERGPLREAVQRSAITLKLLTYTLSGAIIAAPTTSLPEKIGSVRNWDYRYCWLRDAAMTLRALLDLNYFAEGQAFLGWMLHATRLSAPELNVLYDVYGEVEIPERNLDHFEGYMHSRPVRVGNGAWNQLQLDVYGELVLGAYDYVQRGGRLDRFERNRLVGFGQVVCRQWRRPDKGLWEPRGAPVHHTHSKVMCWVALDRLVRLHHQGHVQLPLQRFEREMQAIREAIEAHGYDDGLGSYVGVFGKRELDAALLLMPRYGYVRADDPRMVSTLNAIDLKLSRGALVYRYCAGDDLPSGEGAFGVCSFWMVDCLARAGRLDEAQRRFAELIALGSDLQLFAEEYDTQTGAALGNFPQAFTHVGLVTAALTLAQSRGERRVQE